METVPEAKRGKTRNNCQLHGFESMALVPIAMEDRRIGLIHLADPHENRVPLKTVHLVEKLANELGPNIQRIKAEQQLQEMMSDLKRSNAELEQFASIISHDLREPLRMVSSYVKLLAKRYQGQLDENADTFIHYAVDGAERMQRMISDLLTYAHVGKKGNPFALTDCAHAVEAALKNLELGIQDNNATITIDTPLPQVEGDQSQLIQLFQNLIGNAIKFRRSEAVKVTLGAKQEGGDWIFSVADDGIGIEAQHTEHIFGLFQRLHTSEEYAGTGVGLAVCKKIVERHGGKIWVKSVPNKGTTFSFTIPKSTLEVETEAAAEPVPGVCVILQVEDNQGDARLMEEVLSEVELPHEVYVVKDGEEALAFLQQQGCFVNVPRPQIVFLDLHLPKKDGFSVLEEVKADPELRDIPIFVLSSSDSPQDKDAAAQRQADGYFVKPIDLDQFNDAMEKVSVCET